MNEAVELCAKPVAVAESVGGTLPAGGAVGVNTKVVQGKTSFGAWCG